MTKLWFKPNQPALKKTLTYYFQNDGGIKLSFSGVLAQCGSRGRNAVNTSVMDPGTWGREKIIMFHTRDPVRDPRAGAVCYLLSRHYFPSIRIQ